MSRPEITAPEADAVLSLKSLIQKEFDADVRRQEEHQPVLEPNRTDESLPKSVHFAWKEAVKAQIVLSETADFKESVCFCGRGSVRVFNLLPGREYYYKLVCGEYVSPVRHFTVAFELPRQIYLPEMTNVRDCGGWLLADNRRRKYNMIFRGGQMEPWTALPHGSAINMQGEKAWFDLKIKTDLDLRSDGESYFPEDKVSYKKLPTTAYATWQETGIFSAEAMEQIRKIFEFFADETVYPVYMHCMGGGDRTGTIAFLLGAMLGMSEEDLINDYEYSNLSLSGERCRCSAVWKAFMAKLNEFAPGGTMQEKVINYLEKCGVTEEIREKIAAVLIEKK